jgi:hypothetical protein
LRQSIAVRQSMGEAHKNKIKLTLKKHVRFLSAYMFFSFYRFFIRLEKNIKNGSVTSSD